MVDSAAKTHPQDFVIAFLFSRITYKDRNITGNNLAYLGFEAPEDTGEQTLCVGLGG